MIDHAAITITAHALARLQERWPLPQQPKRDWEKTCRRLLRHAQPVKLDPGHAVTRIISNGFRKASYYQNQGIVFVVSEDEQTLLTCELKSMWH